MNDVYYSPASFGLTTVGEIAWSEPCWDFDLTVVWRRDNDGQLFYADDSGCSCPSPFEDMGITDLTPCTITELAAHLAETAESRNGWSGGAERRAMDIANLLVRLVMPDTDESDVAA